MRHDWDYMGIACKRCSASRMRVGTDDAGCLAPAVADTQSEAEFLRQAASSLAPSFITHVPRAADVPLVTALAVVERAQKGPGGLPWGAVLQLQAVLKDVEEKRMRCASGAPYVPFCKHSERPEACWPCKVEREGLAPKETPAAVGYGCSPGHHVGECFACGLVEDSR